MSTIMILLAFAALFGYFAFHHWGRWERTKKVSNAVWCGISIGWMSDNILEVIIILLGAV